MGITRDEYDKKARELKELQVELSMRIEEHQKGENGFRTTLESLISVASQASRLFERSKTEQKRELIAFVFSNLQLRGQKLEFSLRSPFDLMVNRRSYTEWLAGMDGTRFSDTVRPSRGLSEAAKMMRRIDGSIELAACGSSGRKMATFGAWEDTVLEHAFDHVEFISLHTYLNNYAGDTAAFFASPDLMDSFIDEVVAIADAVAARRRSNKRIMLSFDEWNVW